MLQNNNYDFVDEFRLYDYGKNKNMLEYGQSEPPNYNLSSVSSPVALYYGDSDYFVDMRVSVILIINALFNFVL